MHARSRLRRRPTLTAGRPRAAVVPALDVSVQSQVLELLADIRRRFDLAILFITHDLRVEAQVCDSVAVMYQGQILEYGPVSDVFTRSRHAYTRALLDAAPGRGWTFGRTGASGAKGT